MYRLARGLVIGLLALSVLAAGPAEAACTQPELFTWTDPINKNTLTFEPARGRLELISVSPDRRLAGERARMLLSHNAAVVTFRSRDLTIHMRADLARGRVQASAVERLPGYSNQPAQRGVRRTRGPDPNRRTYIVSTPRGGTKGNQCVSAKPGATPVSRPRE